MEDVSDPPFRYVCKVNGADMMYTEFISSEGLIRNAAKSKKKLDIFEHERPIGIQLYGGNSESVATAAKIAGEANPDLIDINFGCPSRKIACRGEGAGALRDVQKMVRITEEVVKSVKLPVTVKTRLGWDENSKNIVEVAERLQDVGIKAITIHARTGKQLYKGVADWTLIGEVKNNPRMKIPVFGNGDVDSPQKAKEMKEKYGVDGIMIGRAAIGNPWIFAGIKHYFKTGELLPPPSIEERVLTAKTHLQKSLEWKGDRTGLLEMRRYYTGYFRGLPDIKDYRLRLVTAGSPDEVNGIFEELRDNYAGITV